MTNLTRHHLLPRSRGWTNSESNILLLPRTNHRAFHTVFSNLTPAEQIENILLINDTCLQKEFKEKILALLKESNWFEYNTWIIK